MNDLSFPNIWLSRKTLDCFIQISTNNKNVKTKDCKSEGLYPVIDQGQQFICGYIDDESKVIKISSPLCVFGDHTRVIKWVTQDFVPGADGTKILEAEKFIFPRYGYYALRFIDIPDKGYSRHFKYLKELEIPIPSLTEQKIIADKLDDLLTRVESIKTRLENIPEILKKFRQSVLSVAVSGKLTEEWRQMKVETSSWRERKLSDIANIIDPHPSHRTPKSVENGVPYIGIGDLKNDGSIDFLNSRKVSIEVLREHNERYVLKKGDFIFGKIGTLGKATSLPIGVDYTLSANVILIQPLIDIVLPQYLQYFLSSPDTMDEIARQSNSTSQSAFGIKKMRLFQCKLPSKEEQKEIIIIIEKYFSHIDSIECKAIDTLALIGNLTQSILAKAFRGELTAQWREENPELISGLNSAEALLEKITAEKLAAGTVKKRAKKTSH